MPIIIIVLLSAIAGTVMWLVSDELLIGYAIGISLGTALGITLLIYLTRTLGRRARSSLFASEAFRKLTRYKATIYHIHGQQAKSVSATVYENDGNDYENLVDILKRQMQFPINTAREAAKYAMDVAHDKPIQDKIVEALQYMDSGNNGDKATTGT